MRPPPTWIERRAYFLYHNFKRTPIAQYTIFGGERFEKLNRVPWPETHGVVTEVDGECTDGDFTFGLFVPEDKWEYHVECTPLVRCAEMNAELELVHTGVLLALYESDYYFDPSHWTDAGGPHVERCLWGGWLELRPRRIKVLPKEQP